MAQVESLRSKATSGLLWSSFERFGQQAARFIVQIALARILLPEQFGLIAMVTVFISLSRVFVDAGFSSALVQRKEVGDKEISTVFYFNIAISCLMTGLLYGAAPYIAAFYENDELTLILRVLSLVLVISGFGAVQGAMLSRQLRFGRLFWCAMPAIFLSGGIAVWMAYIGYGVWALVAQALISSVLMTCGVWLANGWRPKRVFDVQCLKDMFPFGSRLALAKLLDVGFQNLYILVIGKVFSAADLAYFQRARSFQLLPVQNIQGILGRVTFPLFSKIQDDPVRVKRGASKALQFSTLVVFSGMALLAAIAEPLIITLIGEKWLPSVPYLKWLCISGALFPVHAINVNLLNALGRSDLTLRMGIIKKSLTLLNICLMFRFGIQAIIYGMVVCSMISLWINTRYCKRLIDYSFSQQLKDVMPMIINALLVFAASLSVVQWIPVSPVLVLVAAACAGGVVLLFGLRFFDASLKDEIRRTLNGLPAGRLITRLIL